MSWPSAVTDAGHRCGAGRWRTPGHPLYGVMLLLCAAIAHAETAVHAEPAPSADQALERCHALDDVGDASAPDCYASFLRNVRDEALRAEAFWRLGDFQQANSAFRRAVTAFPDNPDLRTRWGQLFLDAHQAADAGTLFEEALKIDEDHTGALLGMAEMLANRFEGKAHEILDQVLASEPGNTRAKLLKARLYLEIGEPDAATELLLALTDSEQDAWARLDAYALLCAVDHVSGKASPILPSPWVDRALALNPGFGDVHAVPAYFYVITRRYREAVALLKQAAALDPGHWDAHRDLGMNLLRINELGRARSALEHAYSGDPFNAETVNTLRLLDSLDEFDTLASDSLILRAHPDESAIVAPYVRELVNKTTAEMAGRYGFALTRPVVLELYQHHDDFAVRTAGLPGIGILGATFGDVVVMDGPAAKPADEWDWLSAVWHELAHVVTLNATDNLVSRWFSEGVSVYEEHRFGPSQREDVPLDFLQAMRDELLLGVAELDEGFMQPKYPNQIGVSYTQSGLLCTYISENFENGLTSILEAYAAGADTVSAIERGLSVSPDVLDAGFFDYLDSRFGDAKAGLEDFRQHIKRAGEALEKEDFDAAIKAADAAIVIYPEYVGPMSPYLFKARAEHRAENPQARVTLGGYFDRGGRDPGALAHAAQLATEAGLPDNAYSFQRFLARLEPLQAGHHARLAELAVQLGHHDEALTEFQAVLALDPHDKATAHFNVASTLHTLNRTEEARLALLKSLEIAPRYRPALALLIEINQ